MECPQKTLRERTCSRFKVFRRYSIKETVCEESSSQRRVGNQPIGVVVKEVLEVDLWH
jgi:hypothetical protein